MDTNEKLPLETLPQVDPLEKVLVNGTWVFKTKLHCAKYDRIFDPDMAHCEGCDCEKSGVVMPKPTLVTNTPSPAPITSPVPPVTVSASAVTALGRTEEPAKRLASELSNATVEAATFFALAVAYTVRKGFTEVEAENIVEKLGVRAVIIASLNDTE